MDPTRLQNALWDALVSRLPQLQQAVEAHEKEREEADAQLERDLIEAACWKAAEKGWGVLVTQKPDGTLLRAEPHKYVPAGQMYVVQNYGAGDVWTPVKRHERECDWGGCTDHPDSRP